MPGKKRSIKGVLGGILGFTALSAVAGVLITATITPAIALTSTAASSAISIFNNIPGYLAIDKLMLPTEIYATKRDGSTVQLAQFWEQNRKPVTYDQISPYVVDALLSSEDRNFFEHGGIDLVGTARAFLSNQSNGSTQGGSSITQQYVKNILVQRCESTKETFEEKQACAEEATNSDGAEGYQRKLQEMKYAIALEQKYSKEEILLGYLNIASFGGVTYGIEAAAQRYFSTSAANLTVDQAAILVGMVKDPNEYRIDHPEWEKNGAATNYAVTKDRRDYVLSNMAKDGKITKELRDQLFEAPIAPAVQEIPSGCVTAYGAQYFCQMIKIIVQNDPAFGETYDERYEALNRGGLKIFTTLDVDLQATAVEAISVAPPTLDGVPNFGAVATNLEVATGRVLTMAQNTNFSELQADQDTPGTTSLVYGADQRYGRGTGQGFPAGSTFKLFTLLEWLKEGNSVNAVLNGVNKTGWKTGCDGNRWASPTKVNNFGNKAGYKGSVIDFTRDSLNSGFFAMAEKLDMCKIADTAMSMGVYNGNSWEKTVTKEDANGDDVLDANGDPVTFTEYLKKDGTPNYVLDASGQPKVDDDGDPVTEPARGVLTPIDMTTGPFSILGSHNISPLAMAGAYATVANSGIYCEPKFIDRVVNPDGSEHAIPATTCTQVLDPGVAHTAIVALQAVTAGGGTGSRANPFDGTPVFGKTGTHEDYQTWMMESSTAVTTSVWVGNAKGDDSITDYWTDNGKANELRYGIARDIMSAADELYPGAQFPAPDNNLTRQVMKNVPSVVGLPTADAQAKLEAEGFSVTVGAEVAGSQPAGTIESQDPSGQTNEGGTVTIVPSNGKGGTVPTTVGADFKSAKSAIEGAGFSVQAQCTETNGAPKDGRVLATSPEGGAALAKGSAVTVAYEADKCK